MSAFIHIILFITTIMGIKEYYPQLNYYVGWQGTELKLFYSKSRVSSTATELPPDPLILFVSLFIHSFIHL